MKLDAEPVSNQDKIGTEPMPWRFPWALTGVVVAALVGFLCAVFNFNPLYIVFGFVFAMFCLIPFVWLFAVVQWWRHR